MKSALKVTYYFIHWSINLPLIQYVISETYKADLQATSDSKHSIVLEFNNFTETIQTNQSDCMRFNVLKEHLNLVQKTTYFNVLGTIPGDEKFEFFIDHHQLMPTHSARFQ